jgi:hypothetical protein
MASFFTFGVILKLWVKSQSVVLYSWHREMLETWSLVERSSQGRIRFARAGILELSRPDAGTIILEHFRLSAQIYNSPTYLPLLLSLPNTVILSSLLLWHRFHYEKHRGKSHLSLYLNLVSFQEADDASIIPTWCCTCIKFCFTYSVVGLRLFT